MLASAIFNSKNKIGFAEQKVEATAVWAGLERVEHRLCVIIVRFLSATGLSSPRKAHYPFASLGSSFAGSPPTTV